MNTCLPNAFRSMRGRAVLALALTAAALLAPVPLQAQAAAQELTLERVHGDPPLQGRLPKQVKLSPGGHWASFLQPSAADSEQLELWAQPAGGGAAVRLAAAGDLIGTAKQRLSEAEAMALERKRISQRGITGYQWCGDADRLLLFPLSGDLYAVPPGGQATRLTNDAEAPEQDPACSHDGRQVAYVKDGNLWVQPTDAGDPAAPRALTTDATPSRFYGLAEFIAAEEFDRQRGFWWSPDGQRLLVLQVDESGVPLKRRAAIHADHTDITEQRYPAAGEANAKVSGFAVDVATGQRTALPLPADAEYIVRAGWFDDGTPWLLASTRDQTLLRLFEFDRSSGAPRLVLEERDAAWVEVHDGPMELKGLTLSGKPALLWASESSGRRQLLAIDRLTGTRRALTQQPEAVGDIVCSDGERIVFAGAVERGRGRELFVTDLRGHTRALGGSAPRQWRSAVGDRACQRLLVTRSAWGEPPVLQLRALDDAVPPIALAGGAPDPLLLRHLPVPQVVDIVADDGVTPLNAVYFPPTSARADGRKNPVLVMAYGGPGASTVGWRWSGDTAQIAWWQQRGLGVFMLDTRGMDHRDRAFTRAHRGAFGRVEVDDLFAAVRQLPQRVPAVDASRIGFFGWSYGGFLAARAMLDEASPFAAAIAVAPVTDWTLYDSAYTERYLGLPLGADKLPAANYRHADLVKRAALLRRPLLIVHGTADDNVLFEHSLRLIQALQTEGRLFDIGIYPGKAHGISGRRAHLHLYRTMDAFLARHLGLDVAAAPGATAAAGSASAAAP